MSCAGETLLSLRFDTRRHSAQTAPGHSTERDFTPLTGNTTATVDHRRDVSAEGRLVCRYIDQ